MSLRHQPLASGTLRRSVHGVDYVLHLQPTLLELSPHCVYACDALCSYNGQCLNCSGRDRSVKTCHNPFTSSTGVINPGLGNLNDGGYAFQQWRPRIFSYERHVQRNSNRHSDAPTQGDLTPMATPTITAGTTPTTAPRDTVPTLTRTDLWALSGATASPKTNNFRVVHHNDGLPFTSGTPFRFTQSATPRRRPRTLRPPHICDKDRTTTGATATHAYLALSALTDQPMVNAHLKLYQQHHMRPCRIFRKMHSRVLLPEPPVQAIRAILYSPQILPPTSL